ncbi:MAG TPA: hypothetical protein VGO80_13710 [Solirubrobacteraceae bacterium]|nr:hypothetical protein [Solirubrobacteraceae bacterium]
MPIAALPVRRHPGAPVTGAGTGAGTGTGTGAVTGAGTDAEADADSRDHVLQRPRHPRHRR